MSQHLDELVEKLSHLTVLDMSKLKTLLEEKWGVQAAVAVAATASVGGDAGKVEAAASTEFKVVLEAPIPDDKKISIIKAIREILSLGLKEAKDLVEGAPKELKASASDAEAKEIKAKLEAAGAKVSVTGL